MFQKLLSVALSLAAGLLAAQSDSIFVEGKLDPVSGEILVQQRIVYKGGNKESNTLTLLNWAAAYRNQGTELAKRKLEDRKTDLYFAHENSLGSISNLQITSPLGNLDSKTPEKENITIPLQRPLKAGENLELNLSYTLKLPDSRFTGYGKGKENILLKYFFLVPAADPKPTYRDMEETQLGAAWWSVQLKAAGFNIASSLPEKSPGFFEGKTITDPEFYISRNKTNSYTVALPQKDVVVELAFDPLDYEKENLDFLLPLQLQYLQQKTGTLPAKIFISEKYMRKNSFLGIDDLAFWKVRLKMFTDRQKTDIKYLSLLARKFSEEAFVADFNRDHWVINGLKTYLEMQYLKQHYRDSKLLGALPDQLSLYGIKPAKWTNASKLNLRDRYGLGYEYIRIQNLDQKISQPYSELSNMNQIAISEFQAGTLLNFTAEKMGPTAFDNFIKSYIAENQGEKLDTKDFLDQLTVASQYSADYLEKLIDEKNRVNFRLKSYRKEDGQFRIKVSKNTTENIPFQLSTQTKDATTHIYWYDTGSEKKLSPYIIPEYDAEKIVINDNYVFPEANLRDNYLYTQGMFSNMKKPRLKLFTDVPNPEYNEIYINPKVSFNAYDLLMLGVSLKNKSLLDRRFLYSISPYYSSGTGEFTGAAGLTYKIQPADSFFRTLLLGMNGAYFHYDKDLSYRKMSLFSSLNFAKDPRSQISRSVNVSYSYFDRELSEQMVAENDYGKYNLWNFNYHYANTRSILENYFSGGLQLMEDFQKVSAEGFMRWEYAQHKKMSLRLFGGWFISNNTRKDLFDFGISKVSNYSFNYSLLGQSATSGVLSQQYILADGGFKSLFPDTVNHWMAAANFDTHLWKMFSIYADAGVYQNKGGESKFIWDSGVKLRVIPDFLEIYLPVQSSLGFEPGLGEYGKRIRFSLVFNLGAVTNHFRKGWY